RERRADGNARAPLGRGEKLLLRDDSTAPINLGKRKVRFKTGAHGGVASGVVPMLPGSTGDPSASGTTGGATLTVYNANGSGERVVVNLPENHWQSLGSV